MRPSRSFFCSSISSSFLLAWFVSCVGFMWAVPRAFDDFYGPVNFKVLVAPEAY